MRAFEPKWLVLILFILAELILDPWGEFPLNDDVFYSRTIFDFLNTGVFKLSDWETPLLIPQYILGISLTKLFGFSFTLLRIISIASIACCIFVSSNILKYTSINRTLYFPVLMILFLNPLSLNLANTFLPDALTLLLSLVALLQWIKFDRSGFAKHFYLFVLFVVLSSLNRQSGVLIAIVFGILYLYRNPKTLRNVLIGLSPLGICLIVLLAFDFILKSRGNIPANYSLHLSGLVNFISSLSVQSLMRFGFYFFTSCICVGVLFIPLIFFYAGNIAAGAKKSKIMKILFSLITVLVLIKVFVFKSYLPFVGNVFSTSAVGPIIMTGFDSQELQASGTWQKVIWSALSLAGGLSFGSVFLLLPEKYFALEFKEKNTLLFSVLLFLIYIILISLNFPNDRYLLFVLPLFALCFPFIRNEKVNSKVLSLICVPYVLFGVVTTEDYLHIHRTKWKAGIYLTKEKRISPSNIDGGFEFNAWHMTSWKNYNPSHKGRWWWIEDDEYIISPVTREGYTIEKEFPFHTTLFSEFSKFYVLKRTH